MAGRLVGLDASLGRLGLGAVPSVGGVATAKFQGLAAAGAGKTCANIISSLFQHRVPRWAKPGQDLLGGLPRLRFSW